MNNDLSLEVNGHLAEPWSYHAEYSDAPDVAGTVHATVDTVIDLAAEDLRHRVGADPISYGHLVQVTMTTEDEGLKITITPEYPE